MGEFKEFQSFSLFFFFNYISVPKILKKFMKTSLEILNQAEFFQIFWDTSIIQNKKPKMLKFRKFSQLKYMEKKGSSSSIYYTCSKYIHILIYKWVLLKTLYFRQDCSKKSEKIYGDLSWKNGPL